MALACLPDGKTLVSGSRDRTFRVWDLSTGKPMRNLPQEGWAELLAVSADGSLLVTGSSYPELGMIRLWKPSTGEQLRQWSVADAKAGSSFLRGVTLSEDRSSVIAALSDGSLRSWDLVTGHERTIVRPKLETLPLDGPGRALVGFGVEINRAVFSTDGRSVAMISGDWV